MVVFNVISPPFKGYPEIKGEKSSVPMGPIRRGPTVSAKCTELAEIGKF